MIPNVIHFCWFGGKEYPDKVKKCIESWKRYCPSYKIKRWDEENYDITKNKFMRNAAAANKWSFVSDYARLDILYRFGGVYLDTDVELVKNIDDLLPHKAYFGFETDKTINTGLGFGAEAGSPFLWEMMQAYEQLPELTGNEYDAYYCPLVQTPVLEKYGIKLDGQKQEANGILALPKQFLCPMDYDTGKLDLTDDTYSIHWFHATWKTKEEQKLTAVKQKLTPIFGKQNAGRLAVLLMYPRLYGWKKTIAYYTGKIGKSNKQ